jgi:hypothetical protein
MQQSLERATAGLSVRPATRRAVLQAIESPKPAWDWRGVWRWLTTAGLRPALASAVVLVLLLVVSAHYFPRRSAAPAPVAAITPSQHTWVIDVPIRSQTHVYSRERGSVLDAIAPQVSFAHARFLETKKSQ